MAINNSINEEAGSFIIDPGASGDSAVQFDINTTNKFIIGIDDTQNDFSISFGSLLGFNDYFNTRVDGAIILPLQPAFLAIISTQINNVTGNATVYKVQWNTEVFDQGGDWNGSDTFTAPITGKYLFNLSVSFGSVTSGTNGYIEIETSNRDFKGRTIGFNNMKDVNSQLSLFFSITCDLDSADTAFINAMINGIGADSASIITGGSTTPYSWISGSLLA